MPDPRVGAKRSVKLGTGNYGSEGLEVWEERDVSGVADENQTQQAILRRLEMKLEDWKTQHTVKSATSESPKPTPTPLPKPVPAAVPKTVQTSAPPSVSTEIPTQLGSLASITDQKLSDDLDALPWRWNSKHTGHLADWETIPQQTRAALAQRLIPEKNETWRYGMYSYNRFRSDTGRELLCKFPVKAA